MFSVAFNLSVNLVKNMTEGQNNGFPISVLNERTIDICMLLRYELNIIYQDLNIHSYCIFPHRTWPKGAEQEVWRHQE